MMFEYNRYRPLHRVPRGGWFLLGASGLLQPLSEAFLYRSPEEPIGHTCRLCQRPRRGLPHARD